MPYVVIISRTDELTFTFTAKV